MSTIATGSRFDRDLIAIIGRWMSFTSDRDRLNLIRNSGRYLHVRYECSRSITLLTHLCSRLPFVAVSSTINALHKQGNHTYTSVFSHVMPIIGVT